MHDIAIHQKVLAQNIEIAGTIREKLKARGIFTLNLISSPGSGKTTIIEKTAALLPSEIKLAVIEGDLHTELDSQRLSKLNIPVRQINTGKSCHLDAMMIYRTLPWVLEQNDLNLLLIENVGNMVCPAEYDLGEDMKVAVMSVTEGDDKPLKYPAMFNASDHLLINKMDLQPYTNFDLARAKENALGINPHLNITELSCTTNSGIDRWVEVLTATVLGQPSA